MKIFSKTTTAASTIALALGFTLLGPTSPAHAGTAFRIKSATTGKCLQWNGMNKAVTLATCEEKYVQYWASLGGKVANLENNLGGYCLGTSKGMEKALMGRACSTAPTLSRNSSSKTYIWAPQGCYFKTVSGKAICGKKTTDKKKMQWVLDY